MNHLRGKKVLVMGLGLFGGGVGATRFLVHEGAEVTVTDLRSAEDLAPSIRALDRLPVAFKLGGHDETDFQTTDLVIANPGVPRTSPFLKAAEQAGVPITTEICLFVTRCPAPIVGITGSSGKTTTTSLIGDMLTRKDPRTRVGGNIGRSLLDDLHTITPDMPVVLELSSFQLDHLGKLPWSPHMAVVTNFAPNHIDVHGSLDAYRNAKQNILAHQATNDWAIVNADDAEVSTWPGPAQRISFGFSENAHIHVHNGMICHAILGREQAICPIDALRLPGRHNLSNALSATGTAIAWGVSAADVADVLRSFSGMPHRLEHVAEIQGVAYINDSIATSPDRTRVALNAFEGDIILIAGGYDKHIPFDDLGNAIAQKVCHLILLGQTASTIAASIPSNAKTTIHFAKDLSEAVSLSHTLAIPGQSVLLSPASASYDQFLNFETRGETFRKLVENLQQ